MFWHLYLSKTCFCFSPRLYKNLNKKYVHTCYFVIHSFIHLALDTVEPYSLVIWITAVWLYFVWIPTLFTSPCIDRLQCRAYNCIYKHMQCWLCRHAERTHLQTVSYINPCGVASLDIKVGWTIPSAAQCQPDHALQDLAHFALKLKHISM